MTMPGRSDFVERSIVAALSFLRESVFSDEYALKHGFLQPIDPRIKLVSFVVFLLAALFTKNISVLFSLYGVCLALAHASKIGLGFFLKRTWIFIPLFSLFIAIPALFSIFSPGEALVSFNMMGSQLVITRQGLSGASLFVMRVVTSVSFAVLLGLTTKHVALLRVLRIFKLPQLFVLVLGMCYRYIYLFTEIIEHTYLAIRSRAGREVHYKRGQHIVAWNMASLWYRSYQLNEAVYNAMLSRGYTGEPVLLDDLRVTPRDWAWLVFAVALSVGLLYLGHIRYGAL